MSGSRPEQRLALPPVAAPVVGVAVLLMDAPVKVELIAEVRA